MNSKYYSSKNLNYETKLAVPAISTCQLYSVLALESWRHPRGRLVARLPSRGTKVEVLQAPRGVGGRAHSPENF